MKWLSDTSSEQHDRIEGIFHIPAYQYMGTLIHSPKLIYFANVSPVLTAVTHKDQASLNDNWQSDTSTVQPNKIEGSVNI